MEFALRTSYKYISGVTHYLSRLGRTPEFLIYGHGQQRKAVIEAVRLLEDGKRRENQEHCKLSELSDITSPKHLKDKSKKWLKFVTQVMCLLSHFAFLSNCRHYPIIY